ncbi:MAG TPA: hypothetical protein VHP55_00455, partial [Usitatibacter sp.]|nr:hypothetical protein [Usitatibacter sp.]
MKNDKEGELLTLMYVVLDGEATPEQQRSLERTLEADPAARARFEELETLFQRIERLPEMEPPRRFVEGVMAKVGGRFSQPSGLSRVSGSGYDNAGDATPGKTTFPGGTLMSSNGTFRKRTIWAGVAVAAVAAVFAGQYYFDIPPSGD